MKVTYKGKGSRLFDNDICKAMKKLGYGQWASGRNTKTGVRDLAFTKMK